jgi:non-heme chloroperoxidase
MSWKSASGSVRDGYVRLTDDLTLHYQTAGRGGTVIIFVPGWTMTTKSFERQLEFFRNSDQYTVLTYDPRAQGLSSVTMDGHYYEQRARDLKAFVKALNIPSFVLVGWSSGGADILEYLRLYGSEGVLAFTLLEAWPKSRSYDMDDDWVPFGTKDNGDQNDFFKSFVLDVVTDRAAATHAAASWILGGNPTEEALDMVINMSRCTPDSIAALLNATYWFLDNTTDLEKIDGKVPLLYYTRAEQELLARKWAQKHTPSAKVISHGGHMMFWDEHERFNEQFIGFLRSVGL